VVKLVPGVRHRCLIDHLAIAVGVGIGIDHRDEVRLLDAGALVQACEVEEPLARGLQRFGGRGVEGPRVLVVGVGPVGHAGSPLVGRADDHLRHLY
jgi:hypothetical protein